jgi:hypothetical protein
MQFSASSCYFLSISSKYSPYLPVLKHCIKSFSSCCVDQCIFTFFLPHNVYPLPNIYKMGDAFGTHFSYACGSTSFANSTTLRHVVWINRDLTAIKKVYSFPSIYKVGDMLRHKFDMPVCFAVYTAYNQRRYIPTTQPT